MESRGRRLQTDQSFTRGDGMLTSLDETLQHQTPEPFGHVVSSDHRFFDRNWFGCFSPDGRAGVITGLGAYANMNTLDGFAAVQLDGKQHNVRASRPLRPRLGDLRVGPIVHDVVEPLWRHRLALDPNGPGAASFDLTWEGVAPAHLEPRHVDRLDGRLFQDYHRFDQVGTVSGWVQVGNERIEADHWFGARDHSWGIRRGVGGFEPFTGSMPPEIHGMLFIWMEFAAEGITGHVQLHEDGAGRRQSLEGFILIDGRQPVGITDAAHDVRFRSMMRAYEHLHLDVACDDGTAWQIDAEPVLTAWAYKGTGYDSGFDDGKGLGAFRGEIVEHDVYDVSHPEDVVLPDGTTIRPMHREQGARITINGKAGFAHLPVMAIGRIERYGLGNP